MQFDVHVHHRSGAIGADALAERLREAGLDGAFVLSESPIPLWDPNPLPWRQRLDNVFAYTEGHDELLPFFFLDPTEPDAVEQVEIAAERGIVGFKVICTHFMPGDERAMPVYRRMAQLGKPCLFHSGILYDGTNPSGNFNRPCNFEPLLSVPRFRFALAHISWPWTDECIAVFGKFSHYLENSTDPDAPEMFVDITPGTPPRYRFDALAKLLDMPGAKEHVLWGSDNTTRDYSAEYSQSIRARDEEILRELAPEEDLWTKIRAENPKRFLKN